VDLHEREDRDGYLENEAHSQNEDRDEREIVRGPELVLDDLVAEGDEEFDRVRQQHEVAEKHSDDEQADDRQAHELDEAPLLREESRVDVRVDLVQDHGHRERDSGKERHAKVRREVLGRAERYERRRRLVARIRRDEGAVHRDEKDPNELRPEEERYRRRHNERDRGDHEPASQLPEVLNQRELFVSLSSGRSRAHSSMVTLAVAQT